MGFYFRALAKKYVKNIKNMSKNVKKIRFAGRKFCDFLRNAKIAKLKTREL